MTQHIKMIGLDLDGTLLNSKKELLPYTKKVLAQAISKGIVVLVATGRPLTGIPDELRWFPGIRYALTSNGARVLDTLEDKVLIEHLLPLGKAKKALEIFRKYDTLQEVYFDGQGYADEDKMKQIDKYHHDPNMREYALTTRKSVPDIMKLADSETRDADKVQALFADMEERSIAWKEFEDLGGYTLVNSLGYNIEINDAGVNKGTGLVALGRLLGIRREEILACGDSDNDIDMVRDAGIGVAMGNSDVRVKEAADYITDTNENEGAAKAIEKFALKGGE